ncbi:MAG: hypothetical protein ACHQHP_02695, partial [Bacteroidia bacterium]
LKTIRPLCAINTGNYSDNIYISIENCGMGPMIIKRFKVKSINEKNKFKFDSSKPIDNLVDVIQANLSVGHCSYFKIDEGEIIKVGEQMKLIDCNDSDGVWDKRKLSNFLKSLILNIEYTDIYEKKVFIKRESLHSAFE